MENYKNVVNDNYLRDKVFKHGKFMKRKEKTSRGKYVWDWLDNERNKHKVEAYLERYSRNACKASNRSLTDWD